MTIFNTALRALKSAVIGPDGSQADLMTAVFQKWQDGFGGDTLDPNKWDVVHVGTPDYTLVVGASALTVTAGANGGEMYLLSKSIFTIPFDVTTVIRDIGTLSATRMFDVDIVQVDDAGNPVANDFLPGDIRNRAGARIASATATTWGLAALAGNSPIETVVTGNSGFPNRSSNIDVLLAYRPQDTFLTFAPTDSPSAKATGSLRVSSQVPSSNVRYKLRLRFRHAAGSAGAWLISRVNVIDNQEIPVALMGGPGDLIPGNALSVNLASGDVIVAGANASGATTSLRNPLLIAGFDGSAVRRLITSVFGFLFARQPAAEIVVDVASAAKTASGNSGVIASPGGQTIAGSIVVTAVGGTNPTLDLELQESFDGGTSFQVTYDLPRITAAGSYAIPLMTIGGKRRWNWVLGGTSPSFTFAINVAESQAGNAPLIRTLVDRSLNVNSSGSTSPVLNIEGCTTLSVLLALTTAGSTQPGLALQVSMDNLNWVTVATLAQMAAGQLVGFLNVPTLNARFARVVTPAAATGVAAVLNNVVIQAIG